MEEKVIYISNDDKKKIIGWKSLTLTNQDLIKVLYKGENFFIKLWEPHDNLQLKVPFLTGSFIRAATIHVEYVRKKQR